LLGCIGQFEISMQTQFSYKLAEHNTELGEVPLTIPKQLPEFSLDEEIVTLRQRLRQLGVWPDAADQFLALMPHSRWQYSPLVDKDYEWLPQVVEDSLKGVDIGATYPAFFQKLLASHDLRQSFLQMLDSQLGTASAK
jgi:hypothetical protein